MLIIAIEEFVSNRLVLLVFWPNSLELDALAHLFEFAQLRWVGKIWILRFLRLIADLILIVLVALVEMLLQSKLFLLLATFLRLRRFLVLLIVTGDTLVQVVDLQQLLERLRP